VHAAGAGPAGTEASAEDAIPWVKVSRDPEQYAAAMKRAKEYGPIDGPRAVYDLLEPALSKEDQEVFLVVLLDVRSQLRGVAEVHRGGRSRVSVSTPDVLRVVIASGAEMFIVVHNHPTGDPTPSNADKELTEAIGKAAKEVDVVCADHVIVGRGKFYSFADKKIAKAK
jgi:DNA repair protein RadC